MLGATGRRGWPSWIGSSVSQPAGGGRHGPRGRGCPPRHRRRRRWARRSGWPRWFGVPAVASTPIWIPVLLAVIVLTPLALTDTVQAVGLAGLRAAPVVGGVRAGCSPSWTPSR